MAFIVTIFTDYVQILHKFELPFTCKLSVKQIHTLFYKRQKLFFQKDLV